MNTTTKVKVVALGIAVIGLAAWWKKKQSKQNTNQQTTQPDFNGKIIVSDIGNWYAVANGKRWYTGSAQSISDFLAKYPGEVIEKVPESSLDRYPIAGSVYDGLKYIPFSQSIDNAIKDNTLPIEESIKVLGNPYSKFTGI